MENRVYLYQMKDYVIEDDEASRKTHELVRHQFQEVYLKQFRGIPLYADMDIRYEGLEHQVTVEILASFQTTFIIDKNPLYEDDDGITLTLDDHNRMSITWLRPEFEEKYKEDRRYSEIINTYSSWDIFKNLFILRDDVKNRNLKQVLNVL